ncbi:MAG TPA: hypothetical protein VEK76_03605, partial [Candidatus Binatia bacterium]|nr:hypothetical protein [Candidatus Binatia bacterium]
CHDEPYEIVRMTLLALARLDYPSYLVQVVDNNTRDPNVWMPLERLCGELGPRFQFIHLEHWPPASASGEGRGSSSPSPSPGGGNRKVTNLRSDREYTRQR